MDKDDKTVIVADGRLIEIDSRPITAADVLELAGIVGDGVVVRIHGGRASHFAPEQPVGLDADAAPEFRTFRDGAIHHLRVNGLLWEWGAPAITEHEIRGIADIGSDQSLFIEGDEAPIRSGSVVDLTTPWPPQIEVRQAAAPNERVPVVINGRSVTLDRPEVSFEDLVGLAFPGSDPANPGMRSLTVTYRRGPPDRPEGSLVSREAIKVRRGEVFSVTSTDKS